MWNGKWNIGGDPEDHGFIGWNTPECGNYLSQYDSMGGGTPENDKKVVKDMVAFPETATHSLFIIFFFVNPHYFYAAHHDPTKDCTQEDFKKIHFPAPHN